MTPAALRAAVARGDWKTAAAGLDEVQARLSATPPTIGRDEARELLALLPDVAAAAEKANQWSFIEVLLSILALFIPFIVDALTTNDHERAEGLVASLRDKLTQREMGMRFESSGVSPDALDVTGRAANADDARQLFGATVLVRLRRNGALPEGTRLDTPLPADVQSRVASDPALKDAAPPITTYGQLFTALGTDLDRNGRLDVDPLDLQRYLPGVSQQTILSAMTAEIPRTELQRDLTAAGFAHRLKASATPSMVPPRSFGLTGHNEIDRTQQQLLLRTGMIFADANANGRVDDSDTIRHIDANGQLVETTYGALPTDLKRLIRFNVATAAVVEQYAARPGSQLMKFPGFHTGTGAQDPERVNTTYWRVSTATVGSGQQVSWELQPGQNPSDAVRDPIYGNGAQYTTECAHGRTILRLNGLLEFYRSEYGEGEGTFRFNAQFCKTGADRTRAQEHLQAWERFKRDTPGATWESFSAAHPAPALEYSLEVSRHRLFGNGEMPIHPWNEVGGESAAGNNGYFHNFAVSVEGVNIGYVGENVIDLGFRDGVRRYWGHPGGIQTESAWQHELQDGAIPIKSMSDYTQYYSVSMLQRDFRANVDRRITSIQDEITTLRRDQPPGFEATVRQRETSIATFRVLQRALPAVWGGVDPAHLDAAKLWVQSNPTIRRSQDMRPLYNALTPAARTELAGAFGDLPAAMQTALARDFGVAASALTAEQKALAVMRASMVSGTEMPQWVRQQTSQALLAPMMAQWVTPPGQLSSPEAFRTWVASPAFRTWFRGETGEEYAGPTDPSRMSIDQIAEIIELALPMVAGQKTIYAVANRDTQLLSHQMATLLRDGRLAPAEYRPEATATPP